MQLLLITCWVSGCLLSISSATMPTELTTNFKNPSENITKHSVTKSTFNDTPSSFNDHQQGVRESQPTSYFTDLGPNGFVYRGLFEHAKGVQKRFSPFVNEYPDFSLSSFEEIFRRQLPTSTTSPTVYPPFGTLFKRHKIKTDSGPPSLPSIDILKQGIPVEPPDVPLFAFPKYGIYKDKTKTKSETDMDYPKIFRFTDGRINLADFDRKKKLGKEFVNLHKGDEIDPHKIARNKFLILHGGIYGKKGAPLRRSAVFSKDNELFVHNPHHSEIILPLLPVKQNYGGYSYIWP